MLNSLKGEIVIFSFFILLTTVITYPLIFNMNNSIFGDPEWTFDSLGFIHGLWSIKDRLLNDVNHGQNNMVAYPFGVSGDTGKLKLYTSPLAPLLLLVVWKNEIFAYNIYILASFILSGIFMYYLCFYLTKNRLASLASSIIFSFCSNHFLQAFSHMGMAQIQWMPLYILSLILVYERRTYLSAVFCGIAFSLVVLMNYYFGYFMIIFTAGIILFRVGYGVRGTGHGLRDIRLKTLKVIILAGVVALVMILPSTYDTIKNIIQPQKSEAVISTQYRRAYSDLFTYSARTYDYLLPSEYHPVFGGLTRKIVKEITGGKRHWAERTLYLGITPLFLAIMGVVGWRRRRRLKIAKLGGNFYIPLFLFSAALAFYSSLSPIIGFWKIKIPTPSFFLYRMAPMFRVYARMGFVVTLCVAVLAGFGLRDILANIKRRRKQIAVVLTFSSLILFEYTLVPPFRNVDLSETPPIYKWLASRPSDVVIAEYPWLRSIDERHFEYLFYQRVHQKKMVNGAPRGSLGEAIMKEARYVDDPDTASLLSHLGAKYVIVHKDSYVTEDIQRISKNPGLVFVEDFPKAVVYEVVAKKTDLVKVFWKSFAMWERWDDGAAWRWAGNNATLWLCNTKEENVQIDFEFNVLPFHRERTLEIFLNDELVESMKVPVVPEPSLSQRVPLKMELMLGENIVRFFCPEGETKIDDVLHNGDERSVTFGFSNFEIDVQ